MLRISTIEVVMLHLEGRVSGTWVDLLVRICELHLAKCARVTLDLKHVSFVDRPGIAALQNLAARDVKILNALPFIAEQIGGHHGRTAS